MKDLLKSKTFLIIGSVFIILAAVAVTTYFALNPKIKTYKRINYTELNKLINSGERFILFIGSDSCSHCTIFKGTVDEVVEDYGVIVNYIDVSKLTYSFKMKKKDFNIQDDYILDLYLAILLKILLG
jgi:thioredoxin-related protein